MNRILCAAIVALALATSGCAVSSPYMTKLETPQSVKPDPAAATVVFIRPSGYAGRQKNIILDQTGRFLGECWGETYFAVKVAPGQHTFIAWSEGTPALRATVEAGKTYFVEVGVTMGAWSARARLFAMGPKRENWEKLGEWLSESTMLVPDEPAGRAYFQEEADEVREVVGKGLANYGEYEAEARDGKPEAIQKRTLLAADGVAAAIR